MSFCFVLPIVSVEVGETIEILKNGKELAGRSLLLVKSNVDTSSVSIKKGNIIDMLKEIK